MTGDFHILGEWIGMKCNCALLKSAELTGQILVGRKLGDLKFGQFMRIADDVGRGFCVTRFEYELAGME